MNSALLFPGLDALFVPSRFKAWMELREVSAAVDEVSRLLSSLTGVAENLRLLLLDNRVPHLKDFDRATVALTGVQIGIARGLQASGLEWQYVLGCSHGDIARSVICGVASLEDAVAVVWAFAQMRNALPPGRTANVRTLNGTPLSAEQMTWLRSQVPLSVWSSHHATAASDVASIERLMKESRSLNLKVKPVFPFAIHSPHMAPVVEPFRAISRVWKLSDPRWPIFSSVYARILSSGEEVREEAVDGALTPINWVEALNTLCERHQVTRLINVGPSNALTGRMLTDGALKDCQVLDAGAVLLAQIELGAAQAEF